MTPEERQMLAQTLQVVEENNKMLHRMRRIQKLASFMSFLRWVVIIGVSIGAFYFLQPYVERMQNFMQSTNNTFNSFKNLGNKN